MATNVSPGPADQLSLPVPDGTASGDPVIVGGALPGVAITDEGAEGNADNFATVKLNGRAKLSVTGNNGTVGTAIAPGDIVYMNAGALNVNAAGDRFGYALEAVAADATTTIYVKIGY